MSTPKRTSTGSNAVAEQQPVSERNDGIKRTRDKPRFWVTSLWLHIASIALAVVYIILVGVMHLPKYGVTTAGLFAVIGLIAPCMTLLVVSVPELITRWICPWNLGWIPAVHIGLSLITWLSAIATGVFNAYLFREFNSVDGDWEDGCPDQHASGFQCYGKPLLPQYVVTIAINFALAVTHFSLFLTAIMQHTERQALKRKATAA